jgi:hypothetical protein
MPIQFIADVPDSAAISRGVADSGFINKIAIDAQFRAHVAFVSNIATGGGDNTLTYAIGTPDGPLQFFGFQPLIVLKQYQWQFFAVVPPAQWDILSLFDLALDSAGRAHLCYAEMDTFDHAPAPNLKHAVWNAANSQFDSSVVQNSSFATGLAMTIAADDSVHVAGYAKQRGPYPVNSSGPSVLPAMASWSMRQGRRLRPRYFSIATMSCILPIRRRTKRAPPKLGSPLEQRRGPGGR